MQNLPIIQDISFHDYMYFKFNQAGPATSSGTLTKESPAPTTKDDYPPTHTHMHTEDVNHIRNQIEYLTLSLP